MKEQIKPIDFAVSHILEMMDADCILSFGSRTASSVTISAFAGAETDNQKSIHYDLLAIIPDSAAEKPDFMGKLEEFSDLFFTVTLLVRTRSAVQQELEANSRFFHTVLENGELVYSKTGIIPEELTAEFDEGAAYEDTAAYWEEVWEHTAETTSLYINCGNPRMLLPLFHGCLKETCQGLIYVMLGLNTEKGYTLNQLLNLCDSIDPRFQDLLPLATEGDRYHYGLLMAGEWVGRFGRDREPILNYLHKPCDDFRELANEVCRQKLNTMKSEL